MTESTLHLAMKEMVSQELQRLGYSVEVEPEQPPLKSIEWIGYRPDLVGTKRTPSGARVAIVECETTPNRRSFSEKNWHNIAVQKKLFEDLAVTFILAVPFGKISKATHHRRHWEIWETNQATKEIRKVPPTAVTARAPDIKNQLVSMIAANPAASNTGHKLVQNIQESEPIFQ